MSSFIRGGNAVRLAVLLVVLAVCLTWNHVDSPTTTPSDASVDRSVDVAPAEQVVAEGATLVPAAEPLPAVAPGPAAKRAKQARHRHRHHGKHHGKHHRQRKHVSARQAAAGHPGRHRARPHRGGGRDIGWPQCPRNVGFGGRNGLGQPMPEPGVKFVIVGLTNGRAFTPNPCLGKHLRWVRNHHVHASAYAFAAYPSRADQRRYRKAGPYDGNRLVGRLQNAGYAGAVYNIRTMLRHGFSTPHVWLDVEPSSSRPWSGRRDRNAAVVKGWIRAYREAGYTVGVYSTPHLWRGIVGRLRLGLPEWRTAGPASPRAALARCRGESIQGGRAVVAQWWTKRRDFDRICPGRSRSETFARYFHKW